MHSILTFILVSALGLVLQTCGGGGSGSSRANTPATTTTTAPAKTETVRANSNPAAKVDEHGHQDDAARITVADAKADFDADRAIFIDTRGADAYNLEHIKGALNITLNDDASRYNEIPKGKKIIVYCS
jgi:predicted sulfurtransferase